MKTSSPFPSSPKPLHKSLILSLICMWMKCHFHMKGWAPRLTLKKRFKEIRKWPVDTQCRSQCLSSYCPEGVVRWETLGTRLVATVLKLYKHQPCTYPMFKVRSTFSAWTTVLGNPSRRKPFAQSGLLRLSSMSSTTRASLTSWKIKAKVRIGKLNTVMGWLQSLVLMWAL